MMAMIVVLVMGMGMSVTKKQQKLEVSQKYHLVMLSFPGALLGAEVQKDLPRRCLQVGAKEIYINPEF